MIYRKPKRHMHVAEEYEYNGGNKRLKIWWKNALDKRYFYYNNQLSVPYGLSFMKCFRKILVYAKAAAAIAAATSSIYHQDYHIDLIY